MWRACAGLKPRLSRSRTRCGSKWPSRVRLSLIAAIRKAGLENAKAFAEIAHNETGMGRVEDKFAKNVAQARATPGVECLSPQVLTGDNGLTLIENAPWGVVASVTPSTNPAATVINNAISLIAAGNSVVFAPHPVAKKVSQRAITLLNQAVVAAGGPANLLVTVANPDIDRHHRSRYDQWMTGLPQINPVNEQIKQRMAARFGAGYDYTYLYPGVQKVVQAAGRVIRTQSDQGTLFLIDDRFAEPKVQQLLPRWWRLQ